MKEYTFESSEKLNEAVAVYVRSTHRSQASPVVPKTTFDAFLNDKMLMMNAIQEGVSFSLFDLIQEMVPFTLLEWADYLNVSPKSLQRYKQEKDYRFKPILSEKILEMAEVCYRGLQVFGSSRVFKLWLDTPNFALGQHKPLALIRDSYGKDLVLAELTRVDQGIFV